MLLFLSCICIVLVTPDMKLECLPADVFQATIFFRLQTSGTIPILILVNHTVFLVLFHWFTHSILEFKMPAMQMRSKQ